MYIQVVYLCMYVYMSVDATKDGNFPTKSDVMKLKRPFSILSTQALK